VEELETGLLDHMVTTAPPSTNRSPSSSLSSLSGTAETSSPSPSPPPSLLSDASHQEDLNESFESPHMITDVVIYLQQEGVADRIALDEAEDQTQGAEDRTQEGENQTRLTACRQRKTKPRLCCWAVRDVLTDLGLMRGIPIRSDRGLEDEDGTVDILFVLKSHTDSDANGVDEEENILQLRSLGIPITTMP